MRLSKTKIDKIKPNGKVQKFNDGNGLRLEVSKAGTKLFKLRFKINGKDSDITIGKFPSLSLAEARVQRDKLQKLIRNGKNPNDLKKHRQKQTEAKQEQKEQERTFEQIFHEWFAHTKDSWSENHAEDVHNRITQYLIPSLGKLDVKSIKPRNIIMTLKKMEAKGVPESMKRVKQYASRIFRFGVGLGYCEIDPVRDIPFDDIFKKPKKQNLAHITEPRDLQQLLNAIESYSGDISTLAALQLAPHVFLRPSELAGIMWSEVDLKNKTMTIRASLMKMKRAHIVPLSSQALEIIKNIRDYSKDSTYVFPSPRTKARPINEQTLNSALHRLGYKDKHTTHGFRHTASTLLNELGFNSDHIEKQLAHEEGNSVKATYNKAEYLQARIAMMQAWSDTLDRIRSGETELELDLMSA